MPSIVQNGDGDLEPLGWVAGVVAAAFWAPSFVYVSSFCLFVFLT